MDTLYAYPPACLTKSFAFSSKVRYLIPGAFIGCINLEVILITDNSIQNIGFNAFEGCKNLRFINLPKSITKIEQNAFLGCNSLQCGLPIEEKRKDILNEWIKSASLPSKYVKACVLPSFRYNNNLFKKSYFSFILFTLL